VSARRATRALVEHEVLNTLDFRNGLGAVGVSVVILGGSVATAGAEVVSVPDVVRQVTTYDGWQVTLAMTDARYDAVPNMANALLSKEGYLSGRVTLTVEGVGAHPINSGQLVVGAQLGCQVDLSDGLDLGMDLDTDVFDDDAVVGVGPDIGTTLNSGGITAVGFGAKSLKGAFATISILDAHVQVDQCGGAVTARLFASATVGSDTSDDALNVYGEVLPL
jgi:MspA protein